MFKRASRFKARDVTQINAASYRRSGEGSKSVNVRGHYKSTTEINAQEYHQHEASSSDPLKDLYAHVSVGCMHNSADRSDAPKCHEETRQAVQGDVFSWIDHGPLDETLWLTGPAGTGKSAIMGTVCDKLGDRVAASFYFAAYAGLIERKSKRSFVTTLAYQLQRHPHLKERLSATMLSTIREDPAVFEMSLREQMETLILRPLRDSQAKFPTNPVALIIAIDGVDECGEDRYDDPGRSREDDQTEVLSALWQAVQDPTFPFRVIVASRPEMWIREFFTSKASGKFNEIFLDEKYNPDDDIRLFLKSKFAELCRRHGINPVTWPTEDVITKLVQDASGQFIYVATVLRFINTPPLPPREQLEIVLKIKVQDVSNPFAILDALYTSILRSSRSPCDTVIWLKALQYLDRVRPYPNVVGRGKRLLGIPHNVTVRLSAWTVDRLLGGLGSASLLTELPSLVYTRTKATETFDSVEYGRRLGLSSSLTPEVGWDTCYTFYHKSFLDYLEDPLRCGAAFPDVNKGKVDAWIAERCSQTLTRGGPEVPIDDVLLPVFQRCFLDILISVSNQKTRYGKSKGFCGLRSPTFRGDIVLDDALLSHCDSEPRKWLDLAKKMPSVVFGEAEFPSLMHDFVHRSCGALWCKPGCKLWRNAISEIESENQPARSRSRK